MGLRRTVLIADAHETSGSAQEAEFREMLVAISKSDVDVMFLGDIMDLWIAKDSYEDLLQKWFVQWCVTEKERRRIVFVEGNHEFFVAKRYDGVIGAAREDRFMENGILAEHGHWIIGSAVGFNRLLIAFSKSRLAGFLLDVLPFGKAVAFWVKRRFGSNGRVFFRSLPNHRIRAWAERTAAETDAKDIFIGHFHNAQELDLPNGAALHIIPAWKNNHEIMVFEPEFRRTSVCGWREAFAEHGGTAT